MVYDHAAVFMDETPVEFHQEVLLRAHRRALHSNDPNTKVGAILVRPVMLGPESYELGIGHNCLPTGIEHTHERWHDRPTKLRLVVHAEMAAVLDAARAGMRTYGSILYMAQTDSTGVFWGSPPCVRCAVELIQAGVRAIVTYPPREGVVSKWAAEHEEARGLLREARVVLREVSRP